MHRGPATHTAIVAEKPSVGRDISAALGASTRRDGYYAGNGFVVTWAIGHLVALAEPHQIDPQWKAWRRSTLPMLPSRWPLRVDEGRSDQFEVVRKILTNQRIGRVVCATDAGREGELIFRLIYEAAGCDKPVDRLWISSLTRDAIRRGFEQLRPSSEFDDLASAAKARSRADWLVGMNLTRVYSIDRDEVLSVGRVQTPTLAMLVERELAIRNFVPEDYLEVQAEFDAGEGRVYRGTYFRLVKGKRQTRLPADGDQAAAVVERAAVGKADIQSIRKANKRLPPPLLYDLTELQRHANRLYGYSADRTLALAQQLYERHKSITYPRTDSRHLSSEVASGVGAVAKRVASGYDAAAIAEGTGDRPLGKRFVDDAKVTDHHAIVPTGAAQGVAGGSAEEKILDLISRRLLQAWHGDHKYSATTVITRIACKADADQYLSAGTAVDEEGWKVLDIKTAGKRREEPQLPGGLGEGQRVKVAKAEALKKRTRPPARFTEATLLTAMESAGKTLDSKQLSEAMKERGIGTPATRASIIETLLKREYARRDKKQLSATDKGIRLLEIVHPKVRSPAMTGEWESQLREIERGDGGFDAFMRGIEEFVREVVGANGSAPARARPDPGAPDAPFGGDEPPAAARGPSAEHAAPAAASQRTDRAAGPLGRPQQPGPNGRTAPAASEGQGGRGQARDREPSGGSDGPHAARLSASGPSAAPTSPGRMRTLLRERFGHDAFRPHQEDACRQVLAGEDVLLVMPTGAGKSLCYQLPGVARGGTTLVISPLIALMEDQTEKLRQQGFRAERIHSGRDRLESRRVCQDYLAGELDFLHIAPERLAVPGFPELLARRAPGLVAIDEAHCISMWGHDFRPEYRRLRDRVPALRPAPVIALTATATPGVQDDIAEQLGLADCRRLIHGFRRENLQIELVELVPKLRPPALVRLLEDEGRRPAIVYAPTRKASEEQAQALAASHKVAAYHAGMPAEDRDRVQASFLQGEIDIIVATIAFGMGIDKADVRTVVHTGLPGSIEGYYQEIGRAGRDGKPSKAVLLYSWIDRKTHEFFLERDYPEPSALETLFGQLSAEARPVADLLGLFGGDFQKLEKAVEKMWIHGGIRIDADENATRGEDRWLDSYVRQRDHKIAQTNQVWEFTRSQDCRMLDLVRHFGDLEDSLKPCGRCDNCQPSSCALKTFREPTAIEAQVVGEVLGSLRLRDGQSVGKLFREHAETRRMERRAYERLVDAIAAAGLARVENDSFVNKEQERIEFRRLCLTDSGRSASRPGSEVRLPAEGAGLAGPAKQRAGRKSSTSRRRARPDGPAPASRLGLDNVPAPDAASELIRSALRAWRKEEATRTKKPPYVILHNRSLDWIADSKPRDQRQLLSAPGVGPSVAGRYGAHILRIVRTVET